MKKKRKPRRRLLTLRDRATIRLAVKSCDSRFAEKLKRDAMAVVRELLGNLQANLKNEIELSVRMAMRRFEYQKSAEEKEIESTVRAVRSTLHKRLSK